MPERISAVGLTLFWPLYFGAEPCVGSNSAQSSPIFAPGATPRPPTRPAQRSREDVAVEVLHHQHVVHFRLLDELHAHIVDQHFLVLDVRILLRDFLPDAEEEAVRCTS